MAQYRHSFQIISTESKGGNGLQAAGAAPPPSITSTMSWVNEHVVQPSSSFCYAAAAAYTACLGIAADLLRQYDDRMPSTSASLL